MGLWISNLISLEGGIIINQEDILLKQHSELFQVHLYQIKKEKLRLELYCVENL